MHVDIKDDILTRRLARGVIVVAFACGLSGSVFAQQGQPSRPPEKFIGDSGGPKPAPGGGPPSTTDDQFTGLAFDVKTDLAKWIEEAKPRAAAGRKRLLIVWGTNADEMGGKLRTVLSTPDNTRLLGLEFETFWAEVGEGAQAAANKALARTIEAKYKPGAGELPYMTILDDQGVRVDGKSTSKMLDVERSRMRPVYALTRVQEFLTENMTDRLDVGAAVIDGAKSAAREGKALFVWFGEHEERWSERFASLLSRQDVKAAMEPHVRVLAIDLSRTDKGWSYVEEVMPSPQSLPLFMTTDGAGRPVGLSQPKDKANIGMPTDSEEVARLVAMIRAVSTKMTDAQASELSRALLEGAKATAEK